MTMVDINQPSDKINMLNTKYYLVDSFDEEKKKKIKQTL